MNENLATDLLNAVRRVPSAYWILAGVLAVALFFLGDVTPVRYEAFGNGYAESLLFDRLGNLGIWLTAASPLFALRTPVGGAIAAAGLPLALGLVASNHTWPLTAYLGLVAVAVCTQRTSPRAAVGIAAVAVAVPVSLQLGGSMMVPGGAQIILEGTPLPDNTITFGFYLVLAALALGAGRLFRRRVERGLAGAQALARAEQVEEQATVVGERARLARDLHDVVAHHVSLIAVRAETAPYTNTDLDEPARAVLAEIAADARLALDELRGVLGILGRSSADAERLPQPGWSDINALVERSRAAGSVVMVRGDAADSGEVTPSVGYAAYRVVQEALTNARKHAPGRPVTLSLTRTNPMVVVRVGTPLRGDAVDEGIGHGLIGMRERVESLDGRLVAGAVDDEFVVEATLPQGTA